MGAGVGASFLVGDLRCLRNHRPHAYQRATSEPPFSQRFVILLSP